MTESNLRARVYWMMGVSALLFALLGWQEIVSGPITRADQAIDSWMHTHRLAPLTSVFLLISFLHNTFGILAASALILLMLGLRRRWKDVQFLLVVVLGGLPLNSLLKLAFHRQRPSFEHALDALQSYSFPSGHASGSTLFYSAIVVLLANTSWRWPALAGASLMIALVGASRIYLGAHYPSDVLAGVCVGVIWVSACWLILNPRRPP